MRLHKALFFAALALGLCDARPGRTQVLERMACPRQLFQYWVAATTTWGTSHGFVADWRNTSNTGLAQTFFDPVGSTWYGYVPTLTSVDGRARWRYAGIYVGCKKLVWYRPNGTIERVREILETLYTEGTVEEIDRDGDGCGSGGGNGGGGGSGTEIAPVASDDYDPYDNGSGADCAPGGGGTSSGTQYEPGDGTGGETVDWETGIGNGGESTCGAAALVEFVCIDVWVDGVGWVEWGCGYVTTC